MKKLLVILAMVLLAWPSICGAWSFNDFTDEYKSAVDDVIANDSNANGIPDNTDAGGAGTETDPVAGSVTGIVKANGAGTISAAISMTDYMIPFNIYGTAAWQAEHIYAVGATFSAIEEGGSTSYRIVHTGFTSDATYDLTGKETANTYAYYISPAAVSGSEDAFTGWDKDASNDFDGSYASLSNLPLSFIPASHGDDAHSETYLKAETDPSALKAADIGTTVQAYSSTMDTDYTDDFTWDFDYGDLINQPSIPSYTFGAGLSEAAGHVVCTVVDTDTTLTDEQLQDKAGAMWSGNIETRATVTYQDDAGTIDVVVDDMTDPPETAASIEDIMTGADAVTTVGDADTVSIVVGGVLKKITGANAKTQFADGTGLSAASISETNTGTSTAKALTPDALAGSNYGVMWYCIPDDDVDLAVGDNIPGIYFDILPWCGAGVDMSIVALLAYVDTASSSGSPTFQIYNVTDARDLLTTLLTIDATEKTSLTAAAEYAFGTGTQATVTPGDQIRIDCDVNGEDATNAKIYLGIRLP